MICRSEKIARQLSVRIGCDADQRTPCVQSATNDIIADIHAMILAGPIANEKSDIPVSEYRRPRLSEVLRPPVGSEGACFQDCSRRLDELGNVRRQDDDGGLAAQTPQQTGFGLDGSGDEDCDSG
jgi:hypothetical protein